MTIPSGIDLEPIPKKQGLENLGQVIEKTEEAKNDQELHSDINIEELIHR